VAGSRNLMTISSESEMRVPEEGKPSSALESGGAQIVDLMLEIRDMPERRTQIDLDCLDD